MVNRGGPIIVRGVGKRLNRIDWIVEIRSLIPSTRVVRLGIRTAVEMGVSCRMAIYHVQAGIGNQGAPAGKFVGNADPNAPGRHAHALVAPISPALELRSRSTSGSSNHRPHESLTSIP